MRYRLVNKAGNMHLFWNLFSGLYKYYWSWKTKPFQQCVILVFAVYPCWILNFFPVFHCTLHSPYSGCMRQKDVAWYTQFTIWRKVFVTQAPHHQHLLPMWDYAIVLHSTADVRLCHRPSLYPLQRNLNYLVFFHSLFTRRLKRNRVSNIVVLINLDDGQTQNNTVEMHHMHF
jgi:hypothetical protein